MNKIKASDLLYRLFQKVENDIPEIIVEIARSSCEHCIAFSELTGGTKKPNLELMAFTSLISQLTFLLDLYQDDLNFPEARVAIPFRGEMYPLEVSWLIEIKKAMLG